MKMSNNPAKYEVLTKQYLRSILDISVKWRSNKDIELVKRGVIMSHLSQVISAQQSPYLSHP